MANLTPEEILRGIIDGSIEEIESETLTSVAAHRLRNEPNLIDFNAPNAKTVGSYGFANDSALTGIDKTQFTSIADYAFSGTPTTTGVLHFHDNITLGKSNALRLSGIVVEKGKTFGFTAENQHLESNTSLEYVDVGKFSPNAGSFKFRYCSTFDKWIIRATTLQGAPPTTNWFTGTPFASNGSGGTLYVPQSLIASYQSATNWSTILSYANNQILPIEGSIYETQYADGTPIE